MNEPLRLRDGAGAAQTLMQGSELVVPNGARRRALAFAAAAANMAAGGAAMAAGGTALAKSVALCVCLGVVGGGLASLGVSSTIDRWQRVSDAAPASPGRGSPPATVRARPAPPVVEAAPPVAPAPVSKPELAVEPSPKEPSLARAPGVSPAPSASTAGRPSLFDEQRSIEKARAALARGDSWSALTTLDEHERSFPKAQFRPEALALRVEALSQRGELPRARGLAEEFRQRYPHHPLLSRVEAAVTR